MPHNTGADIPQAKNDEFQELDTIDHRVESDRKIKELDKA